MSLSNESDQNEISNREKNLPDSLRIFHRVIIVGAGPGGIQCAYFFEKLGIDYLILERGEDSGTFFKNFPVGEKLISINKVYTGSDNPEINLRMDWNSLLNEEGNLFTNYTDDFYPDTETLRRYLNDFSRNMKIEYNTNVTLISKTDSNYLIDTNNKRYICEKLFIATGMKPIETRLPNYGTVGKEFFKDKNKFKGKSVLLIGSGNSAFEIANMLMPYAGIIIMYGKNMNIAAGSHYAGDVRSVYLPFFDTALLKLQNFIHVNSEKYFTEDDFVYKDGKYRYSIKRHEYAVQEFDYLFFCIGFEFDSSIFNFDIEMCKKHPKLNEVYESINNPNLYFLGTLMHGIDNKKAPGGFIHGFRYSIRYMVNEIFEKRIVWNFGSIINVVQKAFNRLTNDSGLFVLFNQFCDYVQKDGDKYIYIPFVNYQWVKKNRMSDNFITICYNFGVESFTSFGNLVQGQEEPEADVPRFIHPIVKKHTYKNNIETIIQYHCLEDDIGNFNKTIHRVSLAMNIKKALSIEK